MPAAKSGPKKFRTMVDISHKINPNIKFHGELIGTINSYRIVLVQMSIGSALRGDMEIISSLLPFLTDEYTITVVNQIPVGPLDKED